MTDELKNADDRDEALMGADQVLDRIAEDVAQGLKPDSDPADALGDIAEELETAPEVAKLHEAVGKRPEPALTINHRPGLPDYKDPSSQP